MSVWTHQAGKNYEEICRRAATSDLWFRFFKQHQAYQVVLEHVLPEEGGVYLTAARAMVPHVDRLFARYSKNDTLGGAMPAYYDHAAPLLSPSTCRYIWIAADIYHKIHPQPGIGIAEVGGGYGGLAYIMCSTFAVSHYFNYDLPAAESLWTRYADTIGLPAINGYCRDGIESPAIDLFISTWALCELSESVQEDYIKRLVGRAPAGYLICNDRDHATEKRIRKVKPHAKLDQEPCSDLNYVLWWTP